jgi:hypothetical protein
MAMALTLIMKTTSRRRLLMYSFKFSRALMLNLILISYTRTKGSSAPRPCPAGQPLSTVLPAAPRAASGSTKPTQRPQASWAPATAAQTPLQQRFPLSGHNFEQGKL